jgi:hypothetical protein
LDYYVVRTHFRDRGAKYITKLIKAPTREI